MAVEVTWATPQQNIVRFNFQDKWTWREFHEATDNALKMQNSVGHLVLWIYDFSHNSHIPQGVLGEGKRILSQRPANTASTYLAVGGNAILRTLGSTFMKVIGGRYEVDLIFVGNLDEAYSKAEEILRKGGSQHASNTALGQ